MYVGCVWYRDRNIALYNVVCCNHDLAGGFPDESWLLSEAR